MEGLEVNILNLSKTKNDEDNTFRLDAEHYQRKYISIVESIKQQHFSKLKDLIKLPVITGHTPSMSNDRYYGGNISFIKTDNLRANYIKNDFTHLLSDEGNLKIERSQLKSQDIIITIIGATHEIVGRTAIIEKEHLPANINQNIALIRINKDKIGAKYLVTFLNTRYGRGVLHYHSRQTEQVNLNCREVERIIIPRFEVIEEKVASIISDVHSFKIMALDKYKEANEILLRSLLLNRFQLSDSSISIKTYAESFLTNRRLDAEYYQPKFDEIVNKIKLQPYSQLSDLVYITKSIEPGSDAYQESGLPFYRVSNITKYGLTEPDIHIDKHEFNDVIRPRKDTILLTKDGTVGMAYKVSDNIEGITSGAILHLNIKEDKVTDILPDYLTLVLNSKVVQLQAERDAGGSIIKHWKPSEIAEVVIPVVDMKTQQKIAHLVQESFKLKAESEHLLEDAKKLVEYAIEYGEDRALADCELGLIS